MDKLYYYPLLPENTKVQVKRENLPDFDGAVGTIIGWRDSGWHGDKGFRDYNVKFSWLPQTRGKGYTTFIDERYLTTEIEPSEYVLAVSILGEDYFA